MLSEKKQLWRRRNQKQIKNVITNKTKTIKVSQSEMQKTKNTVVWKPTTGLIQPSF